MHKWKSYDVWFLIYGVWQTEFFLTLDHFLPFLSPNNPKNNNSDKIKQTTQVIIILYMCTINENHMMRYEAWQADLFVVLGHFLPFYPTSNPQNLNFEKMK